MGKNIFKKILHAAIQYILSFFKWIHTHQQVLVYALLILSSSIYFVYTLGYSSNWAMVVSETRGTNFYNASQQANRLMNQLGFISLIIALLTLAFSSMSRKKFYMSNIVLSILSIIMLIVNAALTLYYNSVLRILYERITEAEVPAYLYITHGAGEKSYQVFDLGYYVTGFMIVTALFLGVFLIKKLRAQKERGMLLERLVEANER
jgi:hypothetical protein